MYIFAVHSMTGMMKHIVLTLLLCFLTFYIAGCREGKDTAATLTEAEALMYTSPDSALQMLEAIPHPERLTGREQADYALLLTQARSRCRITANSDSLIRIATDYYQHSDNHARKAKAFLYLGDVYMDMQGPSEFNCVGKIRTWDVTEDLHKITIPTLLTSGTDDEATPLIVKTIYDRIPDCRWELIPGGTHLVHVEYAEAYNKLIEAFMAEHE